MASNVIIEAELSLVINPFQIRSACVGIQQKALSLLSTSIYYAETTVFGIAVAHLAIFKLQLKQFFF